MIKCKNTIYMILGFLLVLTAAVCGYYAKGDWVKGQLTLLADNTTAEQSIPVGGFEVTKTFFNAAAPETRGCECHAEEEIKGPQFYCLNTTPDKWDPKKTDLVISYHLEGTSGANTVRKIIYNTFGDPVYRFPDETDVKTGFHSLSWKGVLESGAAITPGKFKLRLYGTEKDSMIKEESLEFEVI